MAMKIETCKTRLNSATKKADNLVARKLKERSKLPLGNRSIEERMEALNVINDSIYDVNGFYKEVVQVKNTLDIWAAQEDQALILDKANLEEKVSTYDFQECVFEGMFVHLYKCAYCTKDKSSGKYCSKYVWVIGWDNLETL